MVLSQHPRITVHGAGLTMLEIVMLRALTDLSTPPPTLYSLTLLSWLAETTTLGSMMHTAETPSL